MMQLIERATTARQYELDIVDLRSLADVERESIENRFSAGSSELVAIAVRAQQYGFRLSRINLDYISGRGLDGFGRDLEATLTKLLIGGAIARARSMLDDYEDLYISQVDLLDVETRGPIYVNRYGIVDVRGPAVSSESAVARLLELITDAIST